jgi:hypothetical protein
MKNKTAIAAIALSVAMATPVFAEYEGALQKKTDEYESCFIGNAVVYMEYHKDDKGKVFYGFAHTWITQQEMAKEVARTKCKKFYPKLNANNVDGNMIIEGVEDYTNQTISNIFEKLYPEVKDETSGEKTKTVWKPEFIDGCFVDNAVQQENPVTAGRIENYFSKLPKGACFYSPNGRKGYKTSFPTIGYGSRIGMEVDIVSEYGLNSENALIVTRHTRENATKFCKEYLSTTSEKCIREEMAIKLASDIKGNCKTGLFSDFFGFTYRFEGKLLAPESDPVTPNYAIRLISSEHPHRGGEVDTGTILGGSSASGYPVNMQIYATLCPASVKENQND